MKFRNENLQNKCMSIEYALYDVVDCMQFDG